MRQDLWYLADAAGLNPSKGKLRRMIHDQTQARSNDLEARDQRSREVSSLAMRDTLLTATDIDPDATETRRLYAAQIASLSPLFEGSALRRTVRSRDYRNQPMWDMGDPIEISMFLKLKKNDIEGLHKEALKAKKKSSASEEFHHVSLVMQASRSH